MTDNIDSKPQHGGRLAAAARRWDIPRSQWLDLSTGINPHSWPLPKIPPAVWQRLPEDDDGLEAVIRRWCGALDPAACVPVAGSQAAIQALPALRAPCRVGVPDPGYEEHRHCWVSAGHKVIPVPLARCIADDTWLAEFDVVIWINPNNPVGTLISRQRLLAWHAALQARGGWLVVDEAFVDGHVGATLAPHAGLPGLVVLRSLGKFFGLAGVRAGAVLTDAVIGAGLRARLGPWSVNGPARYVMAAALADHAWQADATGQLGQASQRLHRLLARHGLADSTGTLLFRYLRRGNAAALADWLASQGILVRLFEAPQAVRFGLPGSASEWQRLDAALTQWSENNRR